MSPLSRVGTGEGWHPAVGPKGVFPQLCSVVQHTCYPLQNQAVAVAKLEVCCPCCATVVSGKAGLTSPKP